MKQSTNLVYM